jgi:peptidyl-prolyl cis-trans isomerase A (cyclophilin A)
MRKLIFAAMCLLSVIPCRAGIITVELETNVGDISVALFSEEAPVTVENFLGYVESGFYDGLIFHRVDVNEGIDIIQGGGYDPNYELRDPCDPIINESYNGLSNVRGTIAMARADEPDSATSQFYINQKNNLFLDWQSPTDVGYCVFGRVVDGMDVVDAIAAEPVGEVNFPGEPEPREDVPIGPNSPIIIHTAMIIDSNHCWYNLAGDLDGSCEVDFADFALMAANWLDRGSPQEFHKNEATNIDTHDLSGNIFVWEGDDDIYSYNLPDGNEFAICTEGHYQRTPAISGHIVVWCDYRNFGSTGTDIYGADISNSNEPNEFDICKAASGQMTPAIDGNIVVWDDYRNSRHDIYGYDLSTETEFPICIKSSDQQQPDVSGNIVVWRDNRGDDYDIYGADITNPDEPNEFVICDANGDQKRPVISGDIVVWEDNRDPNLAIYGYDLSTDVEFFIVSGEIANCDVGGNIVVWQDKRSGEWDIYGYDVSTASEFIVSTADGMQIQPVVSDGTVAWRDYRSLDNDLYWLRLCYLAGDLNSDCTVDINDFSILASQWLDCNIDPPEFCWE